MKNSYLVIGLFTLILLSCNLSSPTTNDPANDEGVKTQTPSTQDDQVGASDDSIPPVISNVTSSEDTIYYEAQDCGPTEVIIYAHVTDNSIASVDLQYNFNGLGAGAESGWKTKKMDISQSGTSYYAVVLDAYLEGQVMGGNDGTLEYQVTAMDQAGNFSALPSDTSLSVSIIACQQQQGPNNSGDNDNPTAVPPTAVPAGNNNNGGGDPSTSYPEPEFTVVNVSSDNVEPGSSVYLEWEAKNATCGVTLNGDPVSNPGDYFYTIPSNAENGSHTHHLVAKGGDCNNPISNDATIPIYVNVPPTATPEPLVYSGFSYPGTGDTVDLDKQGGADAIYNFITYSNYGLTSANGTAFQVWGNSIPSFDACKTTINNGSGSSINFSDGNKYYCFGTGAGHYGYIEYHGFDGDPEVNAGAVNISYYSISSP